MLDVNKVRADFPILNRNVHGHKLVYLDNAATMQMPMQVMNIVEDQYKNLHANVHRGIHYLSEQSTANVERVRRSIAEWINARQTEEVIFTSGTTESVNIVARSFAKAFLGPGDVVVSTEMEHHSNLVPWQEVCRDSGATLHVAPLTDNGELDLTEFERLMELRPKLLAVTMVSNVLGTVNPVADLVKMAHEFGCAVLLDGAQAMRHSVVDVQELDCDFLCFSGHKILAPTGTGVLYGKREWLEKMPPAAYGGGMVDEVGLRSSTYGELPFRFEAGTPNIAGIVGLGAAVDYMRSLGMERISEYEAELLRYTEQRLAELKGVEILGSPKERAGAISLNLSGFHYYDAAKLLDQLGIAVRSGHHCAQPLLMHFGLTGAVRVSPAFYNTKEEIDVLQSALKRIISLTGGRR